MPAQPPLRSVNGSQGYQGGRKVWRLWAVLLIGSCLVSTVAGVVMAVVGVKTLNPVVSKDQGKTEPADKEGAKKGVEPPKQGAESPSALDFSTVDYSFDFSKVDYSPPAGMKGTTRSGLVTEVAQSDDQQEKGKWESVEGYEDLEGKFVRHGKADAVVRHGPEGQVQGAAMVQGQAARARAAMESQRTDASGHDVCGW